MRKIIALLLFVSTSLFSFGQCSTLSVQISSSDTTLIQLYNAGFFNIPSGMDNIVEWEVRSFSGELIHAETTSGAFVDQSSVIFNHSIPIIDSMTATIIITNNTEEIICTLRDTLYWKETEVLPGSFIGNWAVLNSNPGIEEVITSSQEILKEVENITLFPSPVQDYFQIKGNRALHSFTILDANGQIIDFKNNILDQENVDVSTYSPGLYFVQFWDENNRKIGTKKIIKM